MRGGAAASDWVSRRAFGVGITVVLLALAVTVTTDGVAPVVAVAKKPAMSYEMDGEPLGAAVGKVNEAAVELSSA